VSPIVRLALPVLCTLTLVAAAVASGEGTGAAAPESRISIAGSPQVVFDWSREACDAAESPDLPARAFRDHRGRVQLLLSHFQNYRLIGSSLGRLRPDCDPILRSAQDPRPAAFADLEWIASVFTRDGRTIWALVHDEYQGHRHPGRCPGGSYHRCWYNAVTLARSRDGGRSYGAAGRPPRNLVAAPPFRYRPGIGPRGAFGPSNVVIGPDRAHYFLLRVRDLVGRRGVCLMRSSRPTSGSAWRAWDGEGFGARLGTPYRTAAQRRMPCALIEPGDIAEMTESLTYNLALRRYLLVGLAPPGPLSVGPKRRGIYYSTSADLIRWTPRKLIVPAATKANYRCGGPAPRAYPSVIDPGSRSPTFETSGATPFLYYTQFNYRSCRQTQDRDLMRIRLSILR
jgi:hypothetical protein